MTSVHLKILSAIVLLSIFSVLFIYFRPGSAKADSFQLYSSECFGGFVNVENASGSRSVTGTQISEFNETNSAVLEPNKSGDITCKGFRGETIPHAIPTKVSLKFSWAASYSKSEVIIAPEKSDESSEAVQANASSTDLSSSSLPVLNDETAIVDTGAAVEVIQSNNPNLPETTNEKPEELAAPPEPSAQKPEEPVREEIKAEAEVIPPQEAPATVPENPSPLSLLKFLGTLAYAEEVVSSTPIEINSTSGEAVYVVAEDSEVLISTSSASTSEFIVEEPETSYGIVGLEYSVDGENWNFIENMEMDKFDSASFELKLEPLDFATLKNVQVRIKRLMTTDGASPYIYIDAVWLDIEYDKEIPELHPFPSEDRGDIFDGGIRYEEYVVHLVKRPLMDVLEMSSSSTSTLNQMKSEIWISSEVSSTTLGWTFVADEELIEDNPKVFFDYGYVFWIGKGHTLWMFNPKSNSYSSVSIDDSLPTQYVFQDESGEKKVIIISQPGDTVAFENYISPPSEQ